MNECRWCKSGNQRLQCGCGCGKWGHKADRGFWAECRAPQMSPVDASTIKEYGLTQKLSNSIRVY